MQLTLIFISIAFIILSVWYSERLGKRYADHKALLLQLGVTFVIILMAMWVVDIIVFSQLKLLHEETRNEIIAMIKNLFIALVATIIINEKIK